MKTKFYLTFVVMFIALALTSCGEDIIDGDWDPMEWRTEVRTNSKGYVEVPESGGTYEFYCKNYSGFCLSIAKSNVDGKEIWFQPDDENGNTWNKISTMWATITVKGAKLIVEISPNTTASSRLLDVDVTAGDIFHCFSFSQQASNQ